MTEEWTTTRSPSQFGSRAQKPSRRRSHKRTEANNIASTAGINSSWDPNKHTEFSNNPPKYPDNTFLDQLLGIEILDDSSDLLRNEILMHSQPGSVEATAILGPGMEQKHKTLLRLRALLSAQGIPLEYAEKSPSSLVNNFQARCLRSLADLLLCPQTVLPILIGLFNRSGSTARDVYFQRLSDELRILSMMKSIKLDEERQRSVTKGFYLNREKRLVLDHLLILVPVLICLLVSYVIGLIFGIQIAIPVMTTAILVYSLFLITLIFSARVKKWPLAVQISETLCRYSNSFRLFLQIAFCSVPEAPKDTRPVNGKESHVPEDVLLANLDMDADFDAINADTVDVFCVEGESVVSGDERPGGGQCVHGNSVANQMLQGWKRLKALHHENTDYLEEDPMSESLVLCGGSKVQSNGSATLPPDSSNYYANLNAGIVPTLSCSDMLHMCHKNGHTQQERAKLTNAATVAAAAAAAAAITATGKPWNKEDGKKKKKARSKKKGAKTENNEIQTDADLLTDPDGMIGDDNDSAMSSMEETVNLQALQTQSLNRSAAQRHEDTSDRDEKEREATFRRRRSKHSKKKARLTSCELQLRYFLMRVFGVLHKLDARIVPVILASRNSLGSKLTSTSWTPSVAVLLMATESSAGAWSQPVHGWDRTLQNNGTFSDIWQFIHQSCHLPIYLEEASPGPEESSLIDWMKLNEIPDLNEYLTKNPAVDCNKRSGRAKRRPHVLGFEDYNPRGGQGPGSILELFLGRHELQDLNVKKLRHLLTLTAFLGRMLKLSQLQRYRSDIKSWLLTTASKTGEGVWNDGFKLCPQTGTLSPSVIISWLCMIMHWPFHITWLILFMEEHWTAGQADSLLDRSSTLENYQNYPEEDIFSTTCEFD
ncbi:hypothetical protein Ciccas_003191 [Cichlidogyrus casuarinus]|uniref:Uncharacterized protein n=1 Tax=Cichlidogyrus casuarinus TaxID=1844966 RepID=A0ABD2QG02_9PLAT